LISNSEGEIIVGGGMALEKVHTQENCVDMFMKPVPLEKMWWCLASLGFHER
jgi:hypothetical protein